MGTRFLDRRLVVGACIASLMVTLTASCGGGGDTGNDRDSGPQQTTLTVDARDPDGDALSYEWRVTAGTIDNRNAARTVWTLPPGPGLHFAYVMVSDGSGGYAEQQYAVSSDAIETRAPDREAVSYNPTEAGSASDGVVLRLRATAKGPLHFTSANVPGDVRDVYMPDAPIEATIDGVKVTGTTDLSGEFVLPQGEREKNLDVQCASHAATQLTTCAAGKVPSDGARVIPLTPSRTGNVQLHGHVKLRDGGVCGADNEFFGRVDSATVQLRQDGQPLSPPRRVNRFGDYAVDGAGLARSPVQLVVRCGSHEREITVEPPAGGFLGTSVLVPAYTVPNKRPSITRVVANGPDGNVRGRMVVGEAGALSNRLPGARSFLAYKGMDTAKSACEYYRSIGAVKGCDAQGKMQTPISFDDWKRAHRFAPYTEGNTEVEATYVNRRDLNLVRRMVGTRWPASGEPTSVAFYVCNSPGPDGSSQAEIDEVIRLGLADERRIACVAMEWSSRGGVFGGNPFTKFLTFGPDGALIPSVNLDGRGEKFVPGACVACHGGTEIGGRFPVTGSPSPLLGARFLPFDTGNFAFSTHGSLREEAQWASIRDLNKLVLATELKTDSPTHRLYKGWYGDDETTRQQEYVPQSWSSKAGVDSDAPLFYTSVIARSCRTCHVALGATFDWDDIAPEAFRSRVAAHACGGTAQLAINASMPNALASLDRLATDRGPIDSKLAKLMETYMGCSGPRPDPVHPRR